MSNQRWLDRNSALEALDALEELFPEQRLTQIIANACRGCSYWPDLWDVKDELLAELLWDAVKKARAKP